MKDEIKEILEKFNKEVEKTELTRNPYSSEDKKFKHILVSLSEEHFNIFKDILDYITNLQEKYDKSLTDLVHESHKRIELENKITNLQQELLNKKLNIKDIEYKEKMIYKSRNEKANEFIKEHTNNFAEYLDVYEAKELSNILQGEDKDDTNSR